MTENEQESEAPTPASGDHHRSARERQRQGPMWGCLRTLFFVFGAGFLLLFLIFGGGSWYLGSTNFAELVRLRIEKTLEARLGRDVSIGSVQIVTTRPQKVIVTNLRIANAPGGVSPHFATVRRVEITGGIESFWRRRLTIGRIDVFDPHLAFEVFPEGAALTHNFPKWKSGPPSRYEIVRLKFGTLNVVNGGFSFNDRRHEIRADAQRIASSLKITSAEGLYEGLLTSPSLRIRIQDFEPIDVGLRGGFRYTPGILALRSIALEGRGLEAFVSGKLDPLTEGAYDLRVTSRLTLERIREIFRVEKTLAGTLALDTRLTGKQGDFVLAGGFVSPEIKADVYELADAKGSLRVTNDRLTVDVERARYGGGTISADYVLTKFAEPYPMSVDLHYDRISVEKLFSDWGVDGTGLRGAATGKLEYGWNKDRVLEDGRGTGSAKLTRNTVAFSGAKYPIPLAGTADFTIDRGVVGFRGAQLQTESSTIDASGTLEIEGVVTDLALTIRSTDFSELDRIGFNFAHAADKRDYELLGLGGSGTLTGTVRGPIDKPVVAAQIAGTGVRYNEVALGDAEIALGYDGVKSVLTFDRAVFTEGAGTLVLTGTVAFPESGPGPQFDIAVEANGYPAQRAIDAVGLDFRIGEGLATGRLLVAGTPETGRATFAGLTIRRGDAELRLAGDVRWLPGEGNVELDLQIAARDFPVADIISFLDLGTFPVSGQLTGELAIAGPKSRLEGAGSVVVRKGVLFGEPVDLVSADIQFTEGRMLARNALIQSPAGEVRGEAEVDLTSERFSYTIAASSIDLSKITLLADLKDLLGGNVRISSTGAGTFDQPEMVVEATLNEATIRGLALPADAPAPSLYVAIRNGRLIVRGSVADMVTIEGEGTVGENLAVDGTVRLTVPDLARLVALSPSTATLPAAGSLTLDVRLGGKLTPLDALVLDVTAPVFDLRFAGHQFVPAAPLRIVANDGRLIFDSFALQGPDSTFAITGSAGLTGARDLDLRIQGRVDAALLQLAMADVTAEGFVDVNAAVTGTATDPQLTGSAEFQDAEVKFAGFPQLIDEINGTLRFAGDRITIESIRATIGGGSVALGGWVVLDGFRPSRARVAIEGNDVAIRYYEGLVVEGDFRLVLTSDMEGAFLRGDVQVGRGLYFRDFDLQQALLNVILARRGITPVSAASWQELVGLDLRVTADGTLAVRNNIAEVTGTAELDVTGTLANPVIQGEITLAEGGTVTIQNIDYQLVRGTIVFQNPFRIDPFFDVTLEGTASGNFSELESGPIALTINLTGTLDRITPTITSDPPASDITLFSILGLGGISGGGAGGGPGAAVVGQSLLYQSLFSALGSRVLPFVDSFAYDPGLLETGGASPRVTFEKRLSRSVRFLLVYNLDNEESRQVVEWIVNRDWTLQLTRDETDEYRLDARFRRRYGAHWTWGDLGRQTELATFGSLTPAGDVEATPLPPAPRTTPVQQHAFDARNVATVAFRADANVDTSTLGQYVVVKPGQPLTVREVQSSIKNLFATGNFRDVRVDAADTADGVAITFSLYLHYRVGKVELTGIAGADKTGAERAVGVRPGDILSLNAVDDSAIEVQEALANRGFLQSTVDPETSFDRQRSIADVVFSITPGPLAHVGDVGIDGKLGPFSPAELVARMKMKSGEPFRLAEARADADRIEAFLVRRGHRRADVDFLSHVQDPATGLVSLRYSVTVGPRVEVEVTGVSRRSVRRWLPFRGDQAYSEDAVDRAADDIVRALQEKGHFNAAVDTESSLEDGTWTTTFHVRPGMKYRLGDVTFTGNARISDKDLRDVIATSPGGGVRRFLATIFRRPTGVTREQLEDDRESLESYYRLRGYRDAAAGDPIVNTRPDGTLSVVFPVTEGGQTLVTSVTVEGNEQVPAGDLPKPQLRAGDPLNPQLLHDDVVALQTFYANRGNAEVQVTPRVETAEDATTAAVAYVIAEGPQIRIDEVIVRGNTYTDTDVVLRKADLERGDPFSYTSILEAQRELYRLGIFQRIEIQAEQSGTTVADRDVVIEVEEGRNLTLTGAVGLRGQRGDTGKGSEIAPRIAAAASHRNLFGTGRFLGLEGVYSEEQQEAFLTYREPFIGPWNVPLQLQIFQTDDSTRSGATIQQQGTSLEATKVAGLQTRWSLRYEYKISRCVAGLICDKLHGEEGSPIVPDLPRTLLDIQISSITPTFFWDRRDDIIDPHRGFFTSASLEYAFPLQEAKAHFIKQYAQGAWYLPVSDRTVFALSGRLGLIRPLGGTSNRDVPLSERFTAGGENTHRAFPLDRLGDICIDDSGAPIPGCERTLFRETPTSGILPLGGSGMFIVNAEYRFPLFGPVGAAVFGDAGNVYPRSSIRFDELRYGAGVGIRYLSPVGPLRFDVGWPLERRNYERSFSYFITLGYAF
ncbi:MAG: translocation/assembly module TamB domain-containing protein [Thermoanaerobaculia bacterium]